MQYQADFVDHASRTLGGYGSGRTGNWLLYLQALQQMLPYPAAAGHHNYTKSLVLYLTQMEKIQDTHHHVYSKFVDGLFVLRRTGSYWAGIYSDLYIEEER